VDVFFVSLCACYVRAHPSHRYFLAGAEGGEEEVDIDDDLAPVQFAPVVIDKDRGAETGGSKSSSSDGDSSDSGSSSGKNLLSTMTPAVVTTVLMKTPSQPCIQGQSSSIFTNCGHKLFDALLYVTE
jgi:hypothetical protein